jgi:hypothetical protein
MEEHNVIDDAISDRGEGYTVFSIVRWFSTSLWQFSFPTARRGSIQTIRKETQKFLDKGLPREGGNQDITLGVVFKINRLV